MECFGCKHLSKESPKSWRNDWCKKLNKHTKYCDCPSDERCNCGPQRIESNCWEESDYHRDNRIRNEQTMYLKKLNKEFAFCEQQMQILEHARSHMLAEIKATEEELGVISENSHSTI